MEARRPNTEQNLPLVSIDIPRKTVGELEKLEPGNAVRVVLLGTVIEVSRKEPDISFPGFSGLLKVEVQSTKIARQDDTFLGLSEEDGYD